MPMYISCCPNNNRSNQPMVILKEGRVRHLDKYLGSSKNHSPAPGRCVVFLGVTTI